MMMWPMAAPVRMMMRPFKMAMRFVTVMLLFAQLMVMLFVAAMFIMVVVAPVLAFAAYWMMKLGRKRMGRMGRPGRMHMRMPTPRRFKP